MAWTSNRVFIRASGISGWRIAGSAIGGSDVIVPTPLTIGRPIATFGEGTSVAATFKVVDQKLFLERINSQGFEQFLNDSDPIKPKHVDINIETRRWPGTSGDSEVIHGLIGLHFRGKPIFQGL